MLIGRRLYVKRDIWMVERNKDGLRKRNVKKEEGKNKEENKKRREEKMGRKEKRKYKEESKGEIQGKTMNPTKEERNDSSI